MAGPAQSQLGPAAQPRPRSAGATVPSWDHLGAVCGTAAGGDPVLFTPLRAGQDERAARSEMKESAGRGQEGREAQQLASLSSPPLSFPRQSCPEQAASTEPPPCRRPQGEMPSRRPPGCAGMGAAVPLWCHGLSWPLAEVLAMVRPMCWDKARRLSW